MQTATPAPHKKKRSRYDGKKLEMLHDSRKLLILVVVLFLLLRFVIGFSVISGVSMLDTLHNGELVFYTRIHGEIQRGQVISVRIPTGEYYIKRVIAVGGDTVDLREGVLYVNGVAEEGDYIRGVTLAENGAFSYPFTVEEGDLFVLGDNREESVDSRSFGTVSSRQIKGVIRCKIGFLYIEPV